MVELMYNLDYMWTIYIAAKKAHFKKEFIRRPKFVDPDDDKMNKVIEIIEELGAEPTDYINYQIYRLSSMRIFPTPAHLASDKAKMAYKIHQSRKGKSDAKLYTTDGNTFTVKKSYASYDIKQAESKDGQDEDAQFVLFLASQDSLPIEEVIKHKDKIFYLEAKYNYLFKQPTDKLKSLFDRANEEVL
jgi:hypothetical protein